MDEQGLPQGFEAPNGDDAGPAAGMISQYVNDRSFTYCEIIPATMPAPPPV